VNQVWRETAPRLPRPSDSVLATRRAVNLRDVHALLEPAQAARMPVRSAISLPMFAGDELLGTLSIGSADRDRFTDEDVRLVSIIANHLAIAVQNARLLVVARTGKTQWEATFDAINDPIAVFNADGRLVRWNAALAAYLERPVSALRHMSCDQVGLCGGMFGDCAVARAASDQPARMDVTGRDDQIFTVTTTPVSGGPDGAAVVQIAKNVTQEIRGARRLQAMSEEIAATNARLLATVERLKMTQAQLLQAEKLSAIGQLVAGVAHELNNPLTSVIGYAQLVNDELASRPDLAEAADSLSVDVSRILTESERAARIVRNLLTFARSQSSERERQDLADLCARVVQLRAYDFRLKEIEVVTRFSAGLPPVHADGGQIQQVLLNLLLNAEQAMKKAEMRRLEISVGFEADCGAVLTEIRDTGHGIETSNLRRIFDPFFTTRGVGEGTGLGLSIAYGIVRDHGGQIWAESRPERTSFFIRLPARIDAELADRIGTVLVAHGDPVMRDFLGAVFAGWGFVVRSVPDLAEALESLAEDDIGLAVVDRTIVEPDPGRWEAAWARCPRRPTLIVIALSSAERETVRFFRSEAPVVLAPPYDLYQIRCALLAAVGVES
jgi:signal transduction histidine kinase/CheY-like chemotaxis protein